MLILDEADRARAPIDNINRGRDGENGRADPMPIERLYLFAGWTLEQLDDVGCQPLFVVSPRWNAPLSSSGAVRADGTPDARTASAHTGLDRCTPGGARGLEVSPCRLRQDHLVQRQVRHRAPQSGVLRLQVLQLLHLA